MSPWPDNRLTLSHKHLLQSHGMSVQFIYIVRGSERKNWTLAKVTAQAVAKVVEEKVGPKFQAAGGKIVFGDNDEKLHSDVSKFLLSKKFYLSV